MEAMLNGLGYEHGVWIHLSVGPFYFIQISFRGPIFRCPIHNLIIVFGCSCIGNPKVLSISD